MQIPPALDPVAAVQEKFGEAVLHVKQFRDETTLVIEAAKVVEVLLYLRNTPGLVYNFLSDISAVDYYPHTPSTERPERFGVSYHIYSMLYNRRLRLKIYVPEEDTTAPSVTSIWPGANWLEREIFDMMGITFTGHPDMRRILMPEDWDGHPHRRDYPLGYEQVQFSFNVEEILKHKPSAKE
jgi:NADH-quinone oxidoreductase subunit C